MPYTHEKLKMQEILKSVVSMEKTFLLCVRKPLVERNSASNLCGEAFSLTSVVGGIPENAHARQSWDAVTVGQPTSGVGCPPSDT